MSFKGFQKFIKKQHRKKEDKKADLKKGEDIFGLGKSKKEIKK